MGKVLKESKHDIKKISLKLSKKVYHGVIVTKNGEKFIRCSRKRKPFGVFQHGSKRITLNMYNEKVTTEFPTGIVIYGPTDVIIGGRK